MDIEKTIRALTGRGFAVQHFATAAEAADYLDGAIDATTVGIGGSKTIDQLGLHDRLTKHNTVWWHWRTPGFDTLDHALTAPVYLSSANAITEDGQILNIDGRGNRLAAMVYGIGKDGTSSRARTRSADFDSALRARNTAAVQNMRRFDATSRVTRPAAARLPQQEPRLQRCSCSGGR
ncbi:MAG: LUD domain-containing protein [Oscillospiraceae bacterium]